MPYQSSSSKVISRRNENKAGASIATSPVQPKERLFIDTVQGIADADVWSSSLSDLRFLFILLLGFYGSFHCDEIKHPGENLWRILKDLDEDLCDDLHQDL